MDIVIKKMESDDEIRGKAYVYWRSWHEAYPGLVSEDYLDKLTLEKCDLAVSLPMKGELDSLNASVAAGIMMYRVLSSRKKQ